MEPENNIEMIIKGYIASAHSHPLLLIGNYTNKFGDYLYKKYNSSGIRFMGGIYDQEKINNLRYFSALYFHGHSVGGTNPSLIEAMGCNCNIAAHDNIFNRAVLGEDAFYFSDEDSIAAILTNDYCSPSITGRKKENITKVETLYNWETIIQQYEEVFLKAVGA